MNPHDATSVAYAHTLPSDLGEIWLCATVRGVCALAFDAPPARLLRHLARHDIALAEDPPAELAPQAAVLQTAAQQLAAYFDRRLRVFDVPLDLRGTDFQLAVWERLRGIPWGQTRTYGEIAVMLHRPRASQAVGQAVGSNPVALIVPCHRVVGQDGELRGYAYGVARKAALLQREQHGQQLRISS